MKTYNDRMADVTARIRSKKRRRNAMAISCLSLVLVLVASWMLLPGAPWESMAGTDTTGGCAPEAYAQVAEKLDFVFHPKKDNNAAMSGTMAGAQVAPGAGSDDLVFEGNASSGNTGAVEVTDNQVQGVGEADLFKRNSEYIFYMRSHDRKVAIYSIAGKDSVWVSTISIDLHSEEETFGKLYYAEQWEMYLSEDGKTLTVLANVCFADRGTCVMVETLDVSDVHDVSQINRIYLTGSYLSSRMVDGQLLLMSLYSVDSHANIEDPATYVPSIGTPGAMELVAAEDIYLPETVNDSRYTVVCALDSKTLAVNDTVACLSFSSDAYVSRDHIYVSRSYTKRMDSDRKTMSQIVSIAYGEGQLELVGAVEVEGRVKDQYSMDEHNGVLRVVTSIDSYEAGARIVNASLYCISLETLEIITSVDRFAPDWEDVQSVRFDGDKAYVCTAEIVTWTDPVFFFDLTDPYNITWTDTGVIDGYSSSLIQLKNGYLLGIGYGDGGNLKLEVYARESDSVISIAVYEPKYMVEFSEDYKSYYINRETGMFGLAIDAWQSNTEQYILVHFDGYSLQVIATAAYKGAESNVRATMIDGYLYVLSDQFDVVYVG